MTQAKCEFWDYSLTLYKREGVANHCLALQNDFNLDVNLVLFCVWFAQFSGKLPPALLAEAVGFSASWRETIVQPLRNVRSRMKNNQTLAAGLTAENYEELRGKIKKVELQAEKLQQDELQRLARPHLGEAQEEHHGTMALANLNSLCEHLGIGNTNYPASHLQALVSASNKLD